jgi:hypothetical protein
MTSKQGKHLGIAKIELTPPMEEQVRLSVSLSGADNPDFFIETTQPDTTLDTQKSILL